MIEAGRKAHEHERPPAKGPAVVRARIDERTKTEAAAVLAAMGLTVSDAFRLLMVRVAREKALPFAMKEARKGKLRAFKQVEELMADLRAKD